MTESISTLILVAACSAGVSLALLAGWFAVIVNAVPPADWRYRDPLPGAMRLARAPIRILAFYLEPVLPRRLAARCERQLDASGLGQAMTPAELTASAVLSGLASGLLTGVSLAVIGHYSDAVMLAFGLLGCLYPRHCLRRAIADRRRAILRQLPDLLDVITLCLESGRSLQVAIAESLEKGPAGPLKGEIRRALAEMEAGASWDAAFGHVAERVDLPVVSAVLFTISNAQRSGASLGPVLRAEADQRRTERFARAETLAMQAPVKMLFPLATCILPCTFVVIGFLVATKFMHSGM